MSRFYSRETVSSMADLSVPRAKRLAKVCRCGCGTPVEKRKTWAPACYDERLQFTIARNRARYAAARPTKKDTAHE